MRNIEYDGMKWTVDQFIDAYGFTRFAELNFYQQITLSTKPDRLMAVLENGNLVRDCEARQLDWPNVLAIRTIDASGIMCCACCARLVGEVFSIGIQSVCEDCFDDMAIDG